jgi:hypothetical protein
MAYLMASYLMLLMAMTGDLVINRGVLRDYLFGTTLALTVTMTCVYDAAVLGRPWANGARLPFLVVWPIALPAYCIRSRGWWGCVVLLIHVSLVIAIVVAISIIVVVVQALGQ